MKQCNGNGCKTWIDVRMPGSGPGDTSHTIIHIMIYVRNDFVMECSFFGSCLLEHLHVCILYNLFITLFADISQNVGGRCCASAWIPTPCYPKKDWFNCIYTDSKRWLFDQKMSNPSTCPINGARMKYVQYIYICNKCICLAYIIIHCMLN